ncbi:hypothetical protein JMJ35_003255 [Cladonia borealis]|uniref:C2H2-type domain-containing protein n=1 Tax=Cladonia borealis TaxID=184061 RepID=A0AA39R4C8_9LECA|nr:hypothetical protein JMJ35_003255 [Cladonia borealis]
MEGLAAIGLAANILQFIDWTCHILDIGSQIRRQGISDLHMDLDRTAKELEYQIQRIRPQTGLYGCLSKNDEALQNLASDCEGVAQELLLFLNKFKAENNKKGLFVKTLSQAIRVRWNDKKILTLSRRLDSFRQILELRVAVDSRDAVKGSIELLEKASITCSINQKDTLATIQQGQSNIDSALQAQSIESRSITEEIRSINQATLQKQEQILSTIDAFINAVKDDSLFPVLPQMLTEEDPALEPAALNGHREIEDTVLHALEYRMMPARSAEIHENYEKTFNWIFEDSDAHHKPWSNFSSWLHKDSGCYWVRGKAGSGKSTLMKFVAASEKTKKALNEWTGPRQLITCSHFFWHAGTELQKNVQGLLRTLLYQIFSQRRDLISRVFPGRYRTAITNLFAGNEDPSISFTCQERGCSDCFLSPKEPNKHQRKHGIPRPTNPEASAADHSEVCSSISLRELKEAFSWISSQDHLRLCVFVDGLDEFSGNHIEMVDFFRKTSSKSSSLKVIVSSRPEPILVEGFRGCPQLRLEHLTHGDISQYIHGKLYSHTRISEFQGNAMDHLAKIISSRASGVFLWVVLVVLSMLRGLSEGDDIDELEDIVDGYPDELHDLYKHMFGRMKIAHRLQASKLFQYIFRCIEVEKTPPTALRLSFIDKDDQMSSLCWPIRFMSRKEKDIRISTVESRLRSRCCGLIEVHHTTTRDEGTVSLLHMSVLDFWRDPVIRGHIVSETQGTCFDASEGLLASMIARMKVTVITVETRLDIIRMNSREPAPAAFTPSEEYEKFVRMIEAIMVHCHLAGPTIGYNQVVYMQEFEIAVTQLQQEGASPRKNVEPFSDLPQPLVQLLGYHQIEHKDLDVYLRLATYYGFQEYILFRTQVTPPSDRQLVSQWLLVRLVCMLMHSKADEYRKRYVAVIRDLLYAGVDVNAIPTGFKWHRSPWEILIYSEGFHFRGIQPCPTWESINRRPGGFNGITMLRDWVAVVEMFIEAGALLDVQYEKITTGETARQAVIRRFNLSLEIQRAFTQEDIEAVKMMDPCINYLIGKGPLRRTIYASRIRRTPVDTPQIHKSYDRSPITTADTTRETVDGDAPIGLFEEQSAKQNSVANSSVEATERYGFGADVTSHGSIELRSGKLVWFFERTDRDPETSQSSLHEIELLKESLGPILSSD